TMADNLGTAGDPIYNRPTIANILARTDKRGFTGKGPHQFIFTTDWNVEGTECTNGYVICLNSVGTVGKPTNSANIEQDEGFDPVSGDTFSGRVSWCTGYTNDQYNFTIS
ncbi:MAG: hypothetical protein IJG60_06530, partial [Thermoguttaceae bacterium]|nr:hypothetical protein [Thermoguttaceae bacterium]